MTMPAEGISERYSLYAVAAGVSQLGGITQQSLKLGTEVRGEASSAEPYVRFQSVVAQKPSASFTTRHITTALGLCGPLGVSIGTLIGGLKLYAQKWVEGGTRASGSIHRSFTMLKGLLVPTTLSAQHRGDATIGYNAHIIYDGLNSPVVVSDVAALAAISSDAERFALGPFGIEGVCSGQLTDLSVNFGLNVETLGSESMVWDTFSGITSIQPSITLKGNRITWFGGSAIPLAGKAVTHAGSYFFLRKRAAGASFVADVTTQHLKVACAGLAHIDDAMTASGTGAAECSITIPLKFDGTNSPLVISTGVAIA